MLYINNDNRYITLANLYDICLLEVPYFLFVATEKDSRDTVTFILPDISPNPLFYSVFDVPFSGEVTPSPGVVDFYDGQWLLNTYEQDNDINFNPILATLINVNILNIGGVDFVGISSYTASGLPRDVYRDQERI